MNVVNGFSHYIIYKYHKKPSNESVMKTHSKHLYNDMKKTLIE